MHPSLLFLSALVVLAAASPSVHAQYKWRDANGRMVYSDLPPPTSVAPRDVLQAPVRPTPIAAAAGSSEAASAGSAAAGAPTATPQKAETGVKGTGGAASSVAEREEAFRKRRQERLEAEARSAGDAQRNRQTAQACTDAREGLRTLESGMPVATLDARGEPQLLDESQRQGRIGNLRKVLQESCRS